MKTTSFVLMGLSVTSGIGAWILLTLNMLVWAILTFWVGSILAFVGFGLVMFALRPKKQNKAEETEVGANGAGRVQAELA